MLRLLNISVAVVLLGLAAPVGVISVSQPAYADEDGGGSGGDNAGDQSGSDDDASSSEEIAPVICEDGKPCPVVCVQGKPCPAGKSSLRDLKPKPLNIPAQINAELKLKH